MTSEVKELCELEEENARLRKVVADLTLRSAREKKLKEWRTEYNEVRPQAQCLDRSASADRRSAQQARDAQLNQSNFGMSRKNGNRSGAGQPEQAFCVRPRNDCISDDQQSIFVLRKQSRASCGLQTTGSFSLNDVLSTIGTPVRARKL